MKVMNEVQNKCGTLGESVGNLIFALEGAILQLSLSLSQKLQRDTEVDLDALTAVLGAVLGLGTVCSVRCPSITFT